MNLQGRTLKQGMSGDDVALIQSELRYLGYEIPDDELQKKLFDNQTIKRVWEFQKDHELQTTGEVDKVTAERINAEVDALGPQRVKVTVRGVL